MQNLKVNVLNARKTTLVRYQSPYHFAQTSLLLRILIDDSIQPQNQRLYGIHVFLLMLIMKTKDMTLGVGNNLNRSFHNLRVS